MWDLMVFSAALLSKRGEHIDHRFSGIEGYFLMEGSRKLWACLRGGLIVFSWFLASSTITTRKRS